MASGKSMLVQRFENTSESITTKTVGACLPTCITSTFYALILKAAKGHCDRQGEDSSNATCDARTSLLATKKEVPISLVASDVFCLICYVVTSLKGTRLCLLEHVFALKVGKLWEKDVNNESHQYVLYPGALCVVIRRVNIGCTACFLSTAQSALCEHNNELAYNITCKQKSLWAFKKKTILQRPKAFGNLYFALKGGTGLEDIRYFLTYALEIYT